MKQISYVIQFRGSASPREGRDGELEARSAGASSTVSTIIGADGVDTTIEPVAGGGATFVSEVFTNEDGSFTESGTIDFGGGNSFAFSTRGTGAMGPSADPDIVHGAICWQVDSGTGVFDGASGIITSNFTVSGAGDVVDNQWGVIFLK